MELPKGMKGPHRAVRETQDRIDYETGNGIDANHVPGKIKDVPLFDAVEEDKR